MITEESLWPSRIIVPPPSEPVTILREQGNVLGEVSEGDLYGDVEESAIPAEEGVTYEFYVHVTDKPYHYLLLSIHHEMYADFPVRISNTLAGTVTQVHDVEAFKRHLRQIFHAPPTLDLLARMRTLAVKQAQAVSEDEG